MGSKTLIVVAAASLLVVGALGAYVATAPRLPDRPDPKGVVEASRGPDVVIQQREDAPKDESKARSHAIFVPRFSSGGELTFDRRPVDVPRGTDPKTFLLNQFLSSSDLAPSGTRLLDIQITDGTAELQFNASLKDGFGSDDERAFVEGLRVLFGQFDEVKRIELYADGEKLDSLGHLELDGLTVKQPAR